MERLLAKGLARHIESFCREAAPLGAVLVLPRTVILENERYQLKLLNQEVAQLNGAAAMLTQWRVGAPPFDAESVVPKLDVTSALRAIGITVEVQEAFARRLSGRRAPGIPSFGAAITNS